MAKQVIKEAKRDELKVDSNGKIEKKEPVTEGSANSANSGRVVLKEERK